MLAVVLVDALPVALVVVLTVMLASVSVVALVVALAQVSVPALALALVVGAIVLVGVLFADLSVASAVMFVVVGVGSRPKA